MTNDTLDPTSFRMPAEWEPQEAVWLQWPDERMRPAPGYQAKLEWIWIAMTRAMQPHVTLRIVVGDELQRDHVARQLRQFGVEDRNIELHVHSIDDVWMRDNGPIFVTDDKGRIAVTDWNFNGYGGEIPSWKNDAAIPATLAGTLDMPCFTTPVTIEGGAVEVNGTGTFMATESSVLNPNRNPGLTREAVEQGLAQYLGVSNFIWLAGAPKEACSAFGDGTDWHIDIAARFAPSGAALYCWSEDTSDPRTPYLKQHRDTLEAASDERGRKLDCVALPQPMIQSVSTVDFGSGQHPPGALTDGAYTNYLVTNGLVLLPVYGRPEDDTVRAIMAEHFPGREIVGLPTLTLTEEGGAIHCVTQHQPAAKL
ncbi:MAG: agmatine deiminase family protein [Rhodospirillaceae bacterium]|jgi:agmatine deiminase|nr:agmatine deiminase family protein [Rhodospirillaceae bacterium]MBT7612546.1 agmatine deiminase family protein [Rhodospirillaceae bacterium]MBT7648937.1 agmatine deiminase family protein [Rhodospirillaceae bacterium]